MLGPVIPPPFQLRDVYPDDGEAYLHMRCDPVMMAELGGPQPRDEVLDKLRRDVAAVAADQWWIRMIERSEGTVAGTVMLWSHEVSGTAISEIGWMVLPEHQRVGLASAAVRELLGEAARDGRWGDIHAFSGITNVASNSLCRSVGFTLLETTEIDFAARPGQTFAANHWVITP
jgi:RimJ/RimL family protein N-acetyltransferase